MSMLTDQRLNARRLPSLSPLTSFPAQVLLAGASSCVLGILWWYFPTRNIWASVALPIILPVGLFLAIFAISRPFLIALALIILTYYKIDNAFPALAPFNLVFWLAGLTLFSGLWNLWVSRSLTTSWPMEVRALLVFFFIVTVGLPFAKTKSMGLEAWFLYSKIVVLALIISWLPRTVSHFQQAARALILGGIIISAVTIYNSMKGGSVVELTRVVAGGGSLSNPNDLAMLLLAPLAFSASFLVIRTNWFDVTLATLGAVMTVSAIIPTQSRGGLLGVLAILGTTGLRVVKSKALLCSLAIFAALGLYSAMAISDRVSGGIEDKEQLSTQTRLYAWEASARMFAARPLTGVGFGNFTNESTNFSSDLDHEYTAHSVWFLVLGETGLPGFVAFLAMVIACFITCRRNNREYDKAGAPRILKAASLALTASLVGFCVCGSFGSYAYLWPFYIFLAFIVALNRLKPQLGVDSSRVRGFAEGRDASNDFTQSRPAGEL